MTKNQIKTERTVLFTFNGEKFYTNTVYRVKDKQDLNAPEAYKKLGVTKLPSRGINEVFRMRYDLQAKIYDTGFLPTSPCYRDLDATQSSAEAKLRVKEILNPYLKAVGLDIQVNTIHSNYAFWEDEARLFKVDHTTILDTKDPIQAFTLYAAVLTYKVAIEADQKNPDYRNTAYVITDSDSQKNTKNQTVVSRSKAMRKFYTLMDEKRSILISILRYMNLKASENSSEEGLILLAETTFARPEKVNEFLSLYERSADQTFQDELAIFQKISGNGKIQLGKNNRNFYTYNNTELGADLKAAAKNIATLDDYEDIKAQILLD